ncbi:MAG: SDR family oxidoreductase [Alphaproteobacteria bacterium]|uniref:NAD-dependent epimerase/dehydratase family protein n=1 Tax=Pacificispira sp. TaxID=2888761 RepID=UPI001B13B67A|nr:SDR family oxidoreductase [Alphaproteobacteria bacterium]MBO6863516.1 SDR family oxidoreductase [Alphaproteobacteria bacterium]MEC9266170.1 SDR family oxidoreductase [Pseudomonadota bacterium]
MSGSNQFKRVLVTGGAGYVGSLLIPTLLDDGYEVTVFDIMYFGADHLPKDNPNLTLVEGDLRDTPTFAAAVEGHDAVIHLACISNDPSFELDSALSKSINYDCFEPMVVAAKQAGVKRFIYASTSSVYGVSDAPDVREDHPLVPLTDYNKFKGMCEPLLFKHQSDDFTCVTIRPSTVCGYGPRLRLDLTVNILTNHAVNKGKITVFGGEQYRPNLHIKDMVRAYQLLLALPSDKIQGETFNVGFRNLQVKEIAQIVKKVVEEEMPELGEIEIDFTPSNDTRSYRVNSDRIKEKIGFEPIFTVEDAVRDLVEAFKAGKIPNSLTDPNYVNVTTMKMKKAS